MKQPHREAMLQAAEEAGAIVREYFSAIQGKTSLVMNEAWKSEHPHDVVTDADRKAQDAIERIVLGAFPDYGFYAEENGRDVERDIHQNGVRRFVVDPIDGTHNFTKGVPDFSISIALQEYQEGWKNIGGLVYLAAHEELFYAEGGEVCLITPQQEQALTLRKQPSEALSGIRVEDAIYSRVHGGFQQAVEEYRKQLLYAGAYNHKSFSTAQRLAEMAAGRIAALVVGGDFFEWDVAAGLAIAEQAGATIITREDYGLPVIIAAETAALAGVLETIWVVSQR